MTTDPGTAQPAPSRRRATVAGVVAAALLAGGGAYLWSSHHGHASALAGPPPPQPAADLSLQPYFISPAQLGAGWAYPTGFWGEPAPQHDSTGSVVLSARESVQYGPMGQESYLMETVRTFPSADAAHAYFLKQRPFATTAGAVNPETHRTPLATKAFGDERMGLRTRTANAGGYDSIYARFGSAVVIASVMLPTNDTAAETSALRAIDVVLSKV